MSQRCGRCHAGRGIDTAINRSHHWQVHKARIGPLSLPHRRGTHLFFATYRSIAALVWCLPPPPGCHVSGFTPCRAYSFLTSH
eukprot:scaffold9889_cov109-Isochrysis_galbana.AAC.2